MLADGVLLYGDASRGGMQGVRPSPPPPAGGSPSPKNGRGGGPSPRVVVTARAIEARRASRAGGLGGLCPVQQIAGVYTDRVSD